MSEPIKHSNLYTESRENIIRDLPYSPEYGLAQEQVEIQRETYGSNRLTVKKHKHPVIRFAEQFHQPLIYILLAATIVTLALQEWIDAGVILAVVMLNAIVGFLQESKALKAIDALANSLVSETTVIRAGKRCKIDSSEVVLGDIVVLESGDKVPADLRLLRIRDLQIDESALTGESVPSEKRVEAVPVNTALADRNNMAYSSTLATYGSGIGIVTAIGDQTEIGRISALIANTSTLDTPLTKRIAKFSHYLTYAILVLAVTVFVISIMQGVSTVNSFMASIALAVAAIPEGLPAAITIMLAIGVARMAKRRAIIRRLPAVETLGSTTVVCSDKTGTLTQNQMTVQHIATVDGEYRITGVGYKPSGSIEPINDSSSKGINLRATVECGVLCNNALIEQKDNQWHVVGDPTEGALLCVGEKLSFNTDEVQKSYTRIDELPFESANQYMATATQDNLGEVLICIKGSLESILSKCNVALTSTGKEIALDKEAIIKRADAMASKGLRVLAFAHRKENHTGSLSHTNVKAGFLFLGLQGMMDPPRPEAIEAIDACKRAGVDVKMITGDHALTASSIAKQLGLLGTSEDIGKSVVTGTELNDLSEQQLAAVAKNASVFARVTPDNKYRLVNSLQSQGHVVAMTGDGVNDAPALRRADIGVAMALDGTEVAREASDMMLTDDNFATIRSAIEEGRGIFDNLKKFIVWTLPTNGGEGLVILLAVLLGASLPILPVQILWINLTTAILLGLMLVFEPKENDIMKRPPYPSNASLIDSALLIRITLVSILLCAGAFGMYEWTLMNGSSTEQARTVAVAVFVIGEAFYLLNCRSLTRPFLSLGLFSNPWIWIGITGMTLLQLGFTYLPFMNSWFKTEPIDLTSWFMAIAWGFIIFLIVGIEKGWRNKISSLKSPKIRRSAYDN